MRIRKISLRLISIFFLIISSSNVYAKDSCPIFGDPGISGSVAFYLQEALDIMKYVGIILCVVLTIFDFVKSIIMDEKDNFKELTKKAVKRVIYVVVLFFLPIIIDTLLRALDLTGSCID